MSAARAFPAALSVVGLEHAGILAADWAVQAFPFEIARIRRSVLGSVAGNRSTQRMAQEPYGNAGKSMLFAGLVPNTTSCQGTQGTVGRGPK